MRGKAELPLTKDKVLGALKSVTSPAGDGDIVSAGLVSDVSIEAGSVRLVLDVGSHADQTMKSTAARVEEVLGALDGVDKVSVVLTAHNEVPAPDKAVSPRSSHATPEKIPGIDHIVAISSGKGGVGKSTVAANLACALALEGRRVGLLDADVYGPSQPRMLGISDRPASPDGQMILPLRGHGVTLMSIGLMTEEREAVVWRGPMLMGALQQMLSRVQWGALDVLLVDLPPGTGDVQMTLTQSVEIDGAIVVSTPQDVALADARKGIDMFRQTGTPVLGMIENMSTHICSSCGHEEHIFGHGGVEKEASELGVPLLAQIPLHLDIRTASDSGTPVVVSDSESAQADVFVGLARDLIGRGYA